MSRAERAKELFLQGYACSQAVVIAFADITGTDVATLSKAALPFGGRSWSIAFNLRRG